jgi:hypothetical protein
VNPVARKVNTIEQSGLFRRGDDKQKPQPCKCLSLVGVPINMFSALVISADNTVKLNYLCLVIIFWLHMISFGARDVDKKMLTFLELPCSNKAGTLLV